MLGQEVLAPYAKADAQGQPLPAARARRAAAALPGLCARAYLGRVTELILKQSSTPIHLDRVYELIRSRASGARRRRPRHCLVYSAVKVLLRARTLTRAAPPELHGLEMAMDVRVYREKPTGKSPLKARPRLCGRFCKSTAWPVPAPYCRDGRRRRLQQNQLPPYPAQSAL